MKRNPQVVWDVVDGVMVLFHTGAGEFFDLNFTAAFVWSACEDCSMEDLMQSLREEYPEVDRELIEADCRELIASLEENGLLIAINKHEQLRAS
jgi:hypothetical protein